MNSYCGIGGLAGSLALFLMSSNLDGSEPAPVRSTAVNTADIAQWASWRGPSGQGFSDDQRVPLRWDNAHNLLWKTDLPGRGNSSPIVWGDHVFLTSSSDDGKDRFLLCVQTTDGKLLWQRLVARENDPDKSHPWNRYASASCTTDGEHIYAFFGTPGLFCYDFAGRLVWQHTFGRFTSEAGWGTAASPFLFEDLVIQNCDNDGPRALPAGHPPDEAAPMALVALDKRTGQVKWQTTRDQGRGFSTPRLVHTPQGRQDLLLNGPFGLWAYDPATGKEIWHCDRRPTDESGRFGEPIPVSNGTTLYTPSGRPGPFQAIRIGGEGNITGSHLAWEVVRTGHRDVASPLLWNDRVYIADNKGFLTCHDARTGRVLYNARIGGRALASPVLVRGKILFLLEDGTTVVVEPEKKLKILSRNKLGDGGELDFAASPAVADGKLFLRSQTHLYCVSEK